MEQGPRHDPHYRRGWRSYILRCCRKQLSNRAAYGITSTTGCEEFPSVIFSSLITIFSAKDISLRYKRAYHRLAVELAKFDSEDDYPSYGLGQAYDDGARIIDQYPKTGEKVNQSDRRGE